MKYFLYDEIQVRTLAEILSKIRVEGVQQAKLLVMIENILDKGKLMEKEEEKRDGTCNSTGVFEKKDESGHNGGEKQFEQWTGSGPESDTCGNDKAGGNTESDSGSVQGISGSGKPEHGEQLDGFRQ